MRLFVAVNFGERTRKSLITLRDDLRRKSRKGRFTLDENIHLTLIFLGECNATQANAAIAAMNNVTFEPFTIEIGNIGHFKRDGGDLWWGECRTNCVNGLIS